MFSDFGLASSAGVSVAGHVDDLKEIKRVTDTALRLKFIGAAGTAILLGLLAPVIADVFGRPELVWPVRFVALSLFFESMILLYTSCFAALRRVSLNARTIFLESLTEATASIGLVIAGAGVSGAVAGRAIGYAAGSVIGLALLARMVGRPRLTVREPDPSLAREIIAYARPLLLINGAYTLYSYVDALLIGVLLTARDVGEFTAPLRLVALAGYIGLSIAGAVGPRLAGENPDTAAFSRALRFVIILQMLIMVVLLGWAQPLVNVFLGSDYDLAGRVLRGLGPYAFLYGVGPLITIAVTYVGGAKQRVPIVIGALVVNLILDLILLPTIGVMGATIATSVAFAIYVPAHMRILLRSFELDLRPIALTLVRSLAAAGAATGLLLVIGDQHLRAVDVAAGAVAVPLMFGGVLLVLGEVTLEELRALTRLARRRSA
jgi:O-antigen/teichoic acid export membrane protein